MMHRCELIGKKLLREVTIAPVTNDNVKPNTSPNPYATLNQ